MTYYVANLRWTEAPVAEALYERAAEAFERRGETEGEVYSRINRSRLLGTLGREAEARAEIDEVLAAAEASDDLRLRAWGQITWVRQLLRVGVDLGTAHEILRGIEPPPGERNYSLHRDKFSLLGNLSFENGRLAESERAYRKLLALAREAHDRYVEANALYGLARVAHERLVELPSPDRRAESIERSRQALEVAMEVGHREVESLAAWFLADLHPGPEGAELLEHCLRVAESPDLESYCLNPLARRQVPDDPIAAMKLIERSFELARQAGDGWAEIFVWQELMPVYWEIEAPRDALAQSWNALDTIERLRDRQKTGSPSQAGLFSRWSDLYAWLAGRLLKESAKPGWTLEESFRVTERMRARALTDWLRRADPEAHGSASASEDEEFVGLEEVRDGLGPDEALLSFQVAPWEDSAGTFGGGSWLIAVTRDEVSVHRLPGRGDVRRAVRLFGGLVERRDGAEAGPAAHLYEELLGPALAGLPEGIDRLILVPDDALHRLPFAALRSAPDAAPLGARYELVRVPSATLWLHWRGEPMARAERPLLVLADPDLPAAGASPAEALGRLPHARLEGRRAVRAMGGGTLLIGAEASEAAFVGAEPGRFGLIHFAAHAVTDEDRPERSAVLLAGGGSPEASATGAAGKPVERAGQAAADGRLESGEIARLDLERRTVVLASCRSADGTVLRGEGVMSLGRAFFQAGAHGVVASLWPLRDDESEALFGRFYRRLAEGATVAAALRGARREAIEAGEPAAGWAGLVVLGDGGTVPVPGGRQRVPWPMVVAGVTILLVVLVGRVVHGRRKVG